MFNLTISKHSWQFIITIIITCSRTPNSYINDFVLMQSLHGRVYTGCFPFFRFSKKEKQNEFLLLFSVFARFATIMSHVPL